MEHERAQLLLQLSTVVAPITSVGQRHEAGDERGATDLRGTRFTSFDRLTQQARAAETSGFDGVVLPFDARGEDPIIAATAIARRTRRLRIVPEIVSSLATPVYAAKLSVTFQRTSADRMGWLIDADSVGAGPAYGDHTSPAKRLARHHEFLRLARAVYSLSPVDLLGEFFSVRGGGFDGPLAQRPFPSVTVAGSSSGALQLTAALGDRHLFDGADDGNLAHQIHRLDALASERGRQVTASLGLTVVARETEAEARAALEALERTSSRIVFGSYEHVADRLVALGRLGVSEFVLDLTPAVDEAHRFGHFVRPLLIDRGLITSHSAAGLSAAGALAS